MAAVEEARVEARVGIGYQRVIAGEVVAEEVQAEA